MFWFTLLFGSTRGSATFCIDSSVGFSLKAPSGSISSMNTCKKITDFHIPCNQLLGRNEGNVLFNDALNTFYLRLYGIEHMVKDHSDSKRENPLPPHGALFLISSKGSFICTIPDRIAHTMVFVTPVELGQWVHHEGSIWWSTAPWVNALTTELHLQLLGRC